MKADSKKGSQMNQKGGEMNLIEQLRRHTTPDYFTESDRQDLSDRVKKVVGQALSK